MRTWSIKTVVVTLSVTVILAASAPRAEAKPSRTEIGATERITRAVNQIVKRFRGIVANALPTDPIPVQLTDPETATTTTTTTTSSPRKQR